MHFTNNKFESDNFIEIDANGYYDPNSTNVVYALLIVNLVATVIIGFVAFGMKENSLIALNATFIVINIVGIYRWLF